MVAKPWFTGRTSAAALVRKVDKERPTLLLDESDAAFNGDKEYAEHLRGVLNSGYRRSGKSTFCVGQGAKIDVKDFTTFGPKAIAGIGKIPGTIADRSIPIVLRRRTNDEPCERWRERDGRIEAGPLNERLSIWAPEVSDRLSTARPEVLNGLSDRQFDVWEPLFAIADLAGGDWSIAARRAALVLCGDFDENDVNVELLRDVRRVFDAEGVPFIGSTELATKLGEMPERPWADWRNGSPITPRALADCLKRFGIAPRPNEKGTVRGYYRDRFEDDWRRYRGAEVSERQNSSKDAGGCEPAMRQSGEAADASNAPNAPSKTAPSDDLTLRAAFVGKNSDVNES